jgi:SAM-dependent methyltransferase
MEATKKLNYEDFILLNDHLSFHPGGVLATFNLISNVANKSHDQTILDFGCGNGITISFLKRLGYKKIIGYDRNINAIRALQTKSSEFNFYDDIETLLKSVSSIDLLILESIFSFNDDEELSKLIKSIRLLVEKTNIKQIAIVDFYPTGVIPIDLKLKLAKTFGAKEFRTKQQFEEIINSLSQKANITYFNEHIFFLNLKDKYNSNEQVKKLMSNDFFANEFASEEEAHSFFDEFISDMLDSYSVFGEHFKYFECLVTV